MCPLEPLCICVKFTTVEICVLLGTSSRLSTSYLSTTVEICVLLGTKIMTDEERLIYNSRNLCTPWNAATSGARAVYLQQQKFVYSLERHCRLGRWHAIYNSRNLCTPWNLSRSRERSLSTTVEICVLLGTFQQNLLLHQSTTVEICVLLGTILTQVPPSESTTVEICVLLGTF